MRFSARILRFVLEALDGSPPGPKLVRLDVTGTAFDSIPESLRRQAPYGIVGNNGLSFTGPIIRGKREDGSKVAHRPVRLCRRTLAQFKVPGLNHVASNAREGFRAPVSKFL